MSSFILWLCLVLLGAFTQVSSYSMEAEKSAGMCYRLAARRFQSVIGVLDTLGIANSPALDLVTSALWNNMRRECSYPPSIRTKAEKIRHIVARSSQRTSDLKFKSDVRRSTEGYNSWQPFARSQFEGESSTKRQVRSGKRFVIDRSFKKQGDKMLGSRKNTVNMLGGDKMLGLRKNTVKMLGGDKMLGSRKNTVKMLGGDKMLGSRKNTVKMLGAKDSGCIHATTNQNEYTHEPEPAGVDAGAVPVVTLSGKDQTQLPMVRFFRKTSNL